jgi:hypothetical protein
MERSVAETQEIERHKYFLSEKRGHDVGWELAARDWELHHAARWRREQLAANSSADHADHRAAGECCSAQAASSDNGCQMQSVQHPADNNASRRGPLGRLLSRLFQQAS